eukprot:TRINITY_DN618_c0_g1_i6.p1 TRINITY_DN618_c0_g1~~TRINITY_DN618_c0_g1_i6.p1  ORF type:complete len:1214 (-),score=284.07 TRINITY_DN618_c0_g1_i6:625-4266(-)
MAPPQPEVAARRHDEMGRKGSNGDAPTVTDAWTDDNLRKVAAAALEVTKAAVGTACPLAKVLPFVGPAATLLDILVQAYQNKEDVPKALTSARAYFNNLMVQWDKLARQDLLAEGVGVGGVITNTIHAVEQLAVAAERFSKRGTLVQFLTAGSTVTLLGEMTTATDRAVAALTLAVGRSALDKLDGIQRAQLRTAIGPLTVARDTPDRDVPGHDILLARDEFKHQSTAGTASAVLIWGEDAEAAATLCDKAFLLVEQDDLAAAEPLYRRALAMKEQAFDSKHPDTATLLSNLAGLLQNRGWLAQAEPLYRRALDIREQALGAAHPDTATSLNSLAMVLQVRGRLAEAEPLYRLALAIREQALGAAHPDTATSLNNLAGLLQDQGELAEAEPLYRRALAITEEALGPNHPGTATLLNNLASVFRAQGELAEAEPLYQRALAIDRKVLASKDSSTVEDNDLVANLRRSRRGEGAQEVAVGAVLGNLPRQGVADEDVGPGAAVSDVPGGIDSLSHEDYAQALAEQVKHRQSWPLAVGVYAQWGAGKSDLLQRITRKLGKISSDVDPDTKDSAKDDFTAPVVAHSWSFADEVINLHSSTVFISLMLWCLAIPMRIVWRWLVTAVTFIWVHIVQWFRHCRSANLKEAEEAAAPKAAAHRNHRFIHVEFNAWQASAADIPWVSLVCLMFEEVEKCSAFGTYLLAVARIAGGVNPHRWNMLWPLLFSAAVTAALLVTLAVEEAADPTISSNIPAAVWALAAAPFAAVFALSLKVVQLALSGPINKITLDAEDAQNGTGDAYLGLMKRVRNELQVMFKLLRKHGYGMVITIDDLDRCSKPKIVNMLEAVHLLLQIPSAPIIAFLAIDPRIVIAAIEDTLGERITLQASGLEYLDKIIHLPFCIPPSGKEALVNLLKQHMKVDASPQQNVTGQPVVTTSTGASNPSQPAPAFTVDPQNPLARDSNFGTTQNIQNARAAPLRQPAAPATPALDSRVPSTQISGGSRFAPYEADIFTKVIHSCGDLLITPRKLKRIINIYVLQREVLAQAQPLPPPESPDRRQAARGRAELLVRWTFLAELWPFRYACLIFMMGTIESATTQGTSCQDSLHTLFAAGGLQLYLKNETTWEKDKETDRYNRCQRLLATDGDGGAFERLLLEGDMTIERIWKLELHRLAINRNPALSTEVNKFMVRAEWHNGALRVPSELKSSPDPEHELTVVHGT